MLARYPPILRWVNPFLALVLHNSICFYTSSAALPWPCAPGSAPFHQNNSHSARTASSAPPSGTPRRSLRKIRESGETLDSPPANHRTPAIADTGPASLGAGAPDDCVPGLSQRVAMQLDAMSSGRCDRWRWTLDSHSKGDLLTSLGGHFLEESGFWFRTIFDTLVT